MEKNKALGLCLGASTLSVVSLKHEGNGIIEDSVVSYSHEGSPMDYLQKMETTFKEIPAAITGRKFRQLIDLPQITEAEAIEEGLAYLVDPEIKLQAVISAGSETFIIYELDKKRKIKGILTGSKCASGTGEFFLQQLRRMNVSTEEAVAQAISAEPYHISGRCSVFCKSDCTHALNKGEPIGSVAAGLCEMMAMKVLELMPKIEKKNIVFLGGVTKNTAVADILKKEIENLIIPKQAAYFEAYGAALWAMKNSKNSFSKEAIKKAPPSFQFLKPLKDYESLVTFKQQPHLKAQSADRCLLGLDVGSTTTKAVLMRESDDAILASCYLRTNGDPIGASKNCFREINEQIHVPVKIVGLGVTGSGRYISALYADTDAVINEIIAHAEAALHFDKEVDTIFEIGGQDAKYTYLVNGVPCDYAMNEACSAGTGSFLEESAKESLGIDTKDIGTIAMESSNPPNFNDQCAAFISSDIKSAIQEGIEVKDIIAGLVYSICMNYNNKVRGPRTAGKKIFMQGGVCYNKAVPVAMAALTGCPIIVPPDPGLMGAYGVAIEVKRRQQLGLLKEKIFNLSDLLEREVEYGKTFVCAGGAEKCDRKCIIQTISVQGQKFPFGGACNKYYNQKNEKKQMAENLVKEREAFLFQREEKDRNNRPTVGMNRSFITLMLYPLFQTFFDELGYNFILPDQAIPEGMARKGSNFCHPYELAHGYYMDLLQKNPDYIILPHIRELYVPNAVSRRHDMQATCQLVQSETYCLKESFIDLEKGKNILRPILNFAQGYGSEEKGFTEIAASMGITGDKVSAAYRKAVKVLESHTKTLKDMGKTFIDDLAKDPSKNAIVIFGRAYNALSPDINMGIPEKFASRGIAVIPYDMLPCDDEMPLAQMHWATGQLLMNAAQYVKKNKQLFGVWITNFSCGPDSFLQKYFREIMGKKPSLTLELDSHTADAGITTRVEAFLDIVERYQKIALEEPTGKEHYVKAHMSVLGKGKRTTITINTSDGEALDLKDRKVHILMPSMGWLTTQIGSAALSRGGYRVSSLPEPDMETLKYGRANTSCKECLPLILITGMLEKYLANNTLPENEMTLLFVPQAEGGCRLGQYCVSIDNHIENKKLKNLAILSLDNENHYAGLDEKTLMNVAASISISDVMDDIYNTILALAENREKGVELFMQEWEKILQTFRQGGNIDKALKETAKNLQKVKLKKTYKEACKVLLCGEIYVRKERFVSGPIINALGDREIIVKISPFNEWMFYLDYMIGKNVLEAGYSLGEKILHHIQHFYKKHVDNKYRKILAQSGLCDYEPVEIEKIMAYGEQLMSYYLGGDPIISCGASMKEIFHTVSGIIAIGPFACMQSRITEAILNEALTPERKTQLDKDNLHIPEEIGGIPFLAIETDGNVLPQIIDAKLEAFAVQSQRVSDAMLSHPVH